STVRAFVRDGHELCEAADVAPERFCHHVEVTPHLGEPLVDVDLEFLEPTLDRLEPLIDVLEPALERLEPVVDVLELALDSLEPLVDVLKLTLDRLEPLVDVALDRLEPGVEVAARPRRARTGPGHHVPTESHL